MKIVEQLTLVPGRVQNGIAGAPGFAPDKIAGNVDSETLFMACNCNCMAAHVNKSTFAAWMKRYDVTAQEAVEFGLASPPFLTNSGNPDEEAIMEYYAALDVEWQRILPAVIAEHEKLLETA